MFFTSNPDTAPGGIVSPTEGRCLDTLESDGGVRPPDLRPTQENPGAPSYEWTGERVGDPCRPPGPRRTDMDEGRTEVEVEASRQKDVEVQQAGTHVETGLKGAQYLSSV